MVEIKENNPELRKAFVCNTKAKAERTILDCFEKFSDWSKLIRVLAILRQKIKEYKGTTKKHKRKYKFGRKEGS